MSEDRYKTQWFFDLEGEFVARRGKKPCQPSFWNVDTEIMNAPTLATMRLQDKPPTLKDIMHYWFPRDGEEIRQDVAAWSCADKQDGLAARPTSSNVSLHGGGTQALFQALLALREKGCRRVLLVTPLYFSVTTTCEILHFEITFFPTRLSNGCLPDARALAETIAALRPDVTVVTNPTYPVGVLWRGEDLTKVWEACEAVGCTLLLDASQGGLDWKVDPVKSLGALRADNFEHLMVAQSPAKSFFLNGAKFAHLLGPENLISEIRENDESTSGAWSYPQVQLAAIIYRALAAEASDPNLAAALGSLHAARERNLAQIRARHEEMAEMVKGKPVRLTATDSGVLTMLACPGVPMTLENEQAFTRTLLETHEVHAMPGSCARLMEPENPLAYRLNLALPMIDLWKGVQGIVDVLAKFQG
jgi:aspartate/methionine/tyrosine aminotransferase